MAGLKICTRWRAISARRKRRISSSLLPENIGPTTTSIQPIFPLTMSTLDPPPDLFCHRTYLDTCAAVHPSIIERRERGEHRDTKGILASDQIPAQHSPRASRIANADFACKAIDRGGKFHPAIHNFFGNLLRNFDTA